MKSRLMKIVLITALGLATAPLALEQLGKLQYVVERWARNALLSGIVTTHASERQSDQSH